MTVLSRGSILAMAREATPGTYLAPTFTVPWTAATYLTNYAQLRDESVRNNDAVLQGLYQGPGDSTWDMTFHAYPDILGNFLRMVGTDTVTAGVSTTLSASTVAGATSITTALTIPAGSTIKIADTGGANTEYAITGTPSGAGPFTIPIVTPATGLLFAHTSPTCTVVSQTTHTFAQNVPATRPPAFSISMYDGVDFRGFAGSRMSELALKIDPKATVTAQAKFTGFPEAVVASFVYGGTNIQPELGWGWAMTNAGGSSDRGLTLDMTLKRAVEAIHSSNGLQTPREVFPGALELDGSYKAIYESVTDMNLYLNNTQSPTVATITKALAFGGESLAITMSQSGWMKASRSLSGTYVEATFDLAAINNSTDGGITKVVLKNYVTTAY
jgi:hypothetical protein